MSSSSKAYPSPSAQQNLLAATEKAIESLRNQTASQMIRLGAAGRGSEWRLPVLGETLTVNPETGKVFTSAGREVGPWWRILVLHYLAVAAAPERRVPAITFANLPSGRTYAGVYDQRVNGRLCATIGRDAETLRRAAAGLDARWAGMGDLAFDLDVFPFVSMRIVWYAGDEEFEPSASVLLPENIEAFFCVEDIVVLSERLVSRLSGRPF